MNLNKIFSLLFITVILYSCADYKLSSTKDKKEKHYFSSSGFALIYNEELYINKVINKKMNIENIGVMHSVLKINTPVKIINPENSLTIETKVLKKAEYPKIFNVIINQEIASILKLDTDNPFVELIEIKKNKKFIAKESNTFEEERNVAEKVPVNEVKMDDLSKDKEENIEKKKSKKNFVLVVSDFYYENSAYNLKIELEKKMKIDNIFIKKINSNKHRLFIGPFENFNALKTTYISLNNLGFEGLNIYKE